MIRRRAFLAYWPSFLLLFLTMACGQSSDSLKFFRAARQQYSLDNEALMLFARGPTWDGGDAALTAKSNLNSISRPFVPLYELASKEGPLRGFYDNTLGYGLKVQYSKAAPQSPIFMSWAGGDLSWNSKEFKAFMAYAHMSRVQNLVFSQMPSLQARIDAAPARYPLTVYAVTPGSMLSTNFSYNSSTLPPTITFFQHNKTTGLEKLNMIDEADASYHEFGHYIQNLYNANVVGMTVGANGQGNPDMDAIIEGTADYLTVAVTKSERIHVYLENNLNLLSAGLNVREGTQNRSMNHAWRFPDAFVLNSHRDGRVVASALNDIRKYLGNVSTPLSGCTPVGASACYVKMNYSVSGVSDLWIKVFEIAMEAFQASSEQTTYRGYALHLIDKTEAFMIGQGCTAACAAKVRIDVLKLLRARGLVDSDAPATPTISVGTTAASGVVVGASFNFVPFGVSSDLANSDNKLSECEIAIAMPDVYNNTDVVGPVTDLYNIFYRMSSVLNLQEVKDSAGKVVDPLTGPDRQWKIWGVLPPQRRGVNMLNAATSAWFKTVNGAHFAQPASLSNFPVDWGYMVTVPKNRAGATIKVNWEMVMHPKNSDTTLTSLVIPSGTTIATFEQSLVIDDDVTFCD